MSENIENLVDFISRKYDENAAMSLWIDVIAEEIDKEIINRLSSIQPLPKIEHREHVRKY